MPEGKAINALDFAKMSTATPASIKERELSKHSLEQRDRLVAELSQATTLKQLRAVATQLKLLCGFAS